MTRKKSILSLFGAAALTISLTACGGDDAGNGDNGGDVSSDSANADDNDDADADDVDDAAADEPAQEEPAQDDADDVSDNEASGASGEYCSEVEAMGLAMMNPPDPTDGEAVGNAGETFQAIAEIAPADIQADWQTMADAFVLISEIDYTDPDSIAALDELDVEVAADRITDHLMSECGVS